MRLRVCVIFLGIIQTCSLYTTLLSTIASLVSFSVQIHSGTTAFVCDSSQFLNWANFLNAAFSKALKKFKNAFFSPLDSWRIKCKCTSVCSTVGWTGGWFTLHHGRLNVHKSLPCSLWETSVWQMANSVILLASKATWEKLIGSYFFVKLCPSIETRDTCIS